MIKPTYYEIKLMCHACGMDSDTPFFRDYFAAEAESEADGHWRHLVENDWAEVAREPGDIYPNLRMYRVSDAGKVLLRNLQDQGKI